MGISMMTRSGVTCLMFSIAMLWCQHTAACFWVPGDSVVITDRLQGRQQSKRDVESVFEPETDPEDEVTTTARSVDDDMLERERRDAASEDDYDDESVEDEDYKDSYLVDYEEEYSTTADGLLKDFVKIL